MSIFDDLAAEQERLEKILLGLDDARWMSPSAAEGWTIADVVLHLAQSEDAVAATATHGNLRGGLGMVAGETMDERADNAVRMERAAPAEAFCRWQRARQTALAAPDGLETWRFGPADAGSAITGAAGEFCRVAAQRLDPARSGLVATGLHGATALRLVRTYAA